MIEYPKYIRRSEVAAIPIAFVADAVKPGDVVLWPTDNKYAPITVKLEWLKAQGVNTAKDVKGAYVLDGIIPSFVGKDTFDREFVPVAAIPAIVPTEIAIPSPYPQMD